MDAKSQPSADNGVLQQSILAANNITYRLPPDISVASARNNQSQFFANQTYSPGAVGVCILNTGSQYIDPQRCYLAMSVKVTFAGGTNPAIWFGPNGSACNLINRCTVMSRSGTVIELLQNANMLASHTLNFRHDKSWRGDSPLVAAGTSNTTGVGGDALMYGAGPNALAMSCCGAGATYGWETTEIIRFLIPMAEISPVFANSNQLWPASLASGLRIELLFEQASVALVSSVTGTTMDYSIEDIRFEAECYQLSDLVLRALNDQAAESALDVVSMTAYNTIFSRAAATVNVDCSKAVSRAIGFLYRERLITVAASNHDAFACYAVTEAVYPTNYQARLGGLYFPQQSIRSTGSSTTGASYRTAANELYATSLQSLGQFGWGSKGVATNLQEFIAQRFCVYQSMERSSAIGLSGQPMSNARLLNVQMTWSASPASAVTGDLFLFYVVLIRCFLSGTNVEV